VYVTLWQAYNAGVFRANSTSTVFATISLHASSAISARLPRVLARHEVLCRGAACLPAAGRLRTIHLNLRPVAIVLFLCRLNEILSCCRTLRLDVPIKRHIPTPEPGGNFSRALFIGATNYDKEVRAYDISNGNLLWEGTLPFAGNALRATYSANGRQFVVIAAGGGKDLKSKSGGVYVAFALPETAHP
jgi:hypothetical protein